MRLRFRAALAPVVAAGLTVSPAFAKSAEPAAIRDVLACLGVPESASRLACFERSATALAKASGDGDVVVLDRDAIRKTKRDLFGFSVSTTKILDEKSGSRDPDLDEITSTVASVSTNGEGYFIISLVNGGRWEQLAPGHFGRAPRAGMAVTIRRAAFGSYKMKIGEAPAVKARRVG
jgi:hypothetical protein